MVTPNREKPKEEEANIAIMNQVYRKNNRHDVECNTKFWKNYDARGVERSFALSFNSAMLFSAIVRIINL